MPREVRRLGAIGTAFVVALFAAPLMEPALAGTPTFGGPPIDSVFAWPSPAFADIDDDGDLDAFVGENTGSTVFFENTGTVTTPAFAPASTNPFGLADVGSTASPAFADIDDDGDLDAFVGIQGPSVPGPGSMIFFENTGTAAAPAFAAPSSNPFGLADVGGRASPDFADIDSDGDLDAFVGESSGNTIFFENTGTATTPAFAPASTNPFGLADVGTAASPALADVDGDGDLDAFIGNTVGNTLFFENAGTATAPAFAASATNPFGLAQIHLNASPALADLDGDGDLDAFVGARLGRTVSFLNIGTPSEPAFTGPSINPFGLADVGSGASPDLADIDADGDLDVFVGESGGNTIFFENTGTAATPAFAPPSTNPFGLANVGGTASPDFADLDEDGDLDALIGNAAGNTLFFENTGTAAAPGFAAPLVNPFGLAEVAERASPTFADLDGDGDLDAFIGESPGNTILCENTGTAAAPAFAPPSSNPFGLADVGDLASPSLADVDGDGDLDAFVGNVGAFSPGEGATHFFENGGTAASPAFAAPLTDPFGLFEAGSGANHTPTFADIDDDGDLDAFIGESGGNTVFFENLEFGPGTSADGLDNDFDGLIDFGSDPGCASAADPDERSTLQCDDGIDNDLDGTIDWRGDGTGDPDCFSLTDDNEGPPPGWACGLGPELALVLVPLLCLRRRRES